VSHGKFDLAIFDCDGVLVDSELITNRIFVRMLYELGVTVSLDDMFEQFVGRSMPQCLELIARMLGREVPPNFVEDYTARTVAALKSELKAVAGIESALDAIDIPYCVASSGTHEKMRVTLGTTGLLARFENRIFSVTEVARSKPFPMYFSTLPAPSACRPLPARSSRTPPPALRPAWRPA
jgi:beta-phosphoglucomutase-like phosphatase (HAD superfamily)